METLGAPPVTIHNLFTPNSLPRTLHRYPHPSLYGFRYSQKLVDYNNQRWVTVQFVCLIFCLVPAGSGSQSRRNGELLFVLVVVSWAFGHAMVRTVALRAAFLLPLLLLLVEISWCVPVLDRNMDAREERENGQRRRPNFVFYFPDTLRAESFSGYGQVIK